MVDRIGSESTAAGLLKGLRDHAENAGELPPYERVVGLHYAQHVLTTAMTSRLQQPEATGERDALIAALVASATHQRLLVNSGGSIYATELAAAGRRVDSALAQLAAHDFGAAQVVTRD